MLKREVLPRSFVSALCAVFVCLALTALPGVVPAEVRAAMSDEAFVELCGNGTVEQVKQALKDGADPFPRQYGEAGSVPPLTRAAAAGNLPVVRALLEARRERTVPREEVMVDRYDSDVCWTALALMAATESGHAGVVEALLAAGANPKLQDIDGHDALWRARHSNDDVSKKARAEVLRLLEQAARTSKKPAVKCR